jgi:hypothetical protein
MHDVPRAPPTHDKSRDQPHYGSGIADSHPVSASGPTPVTMRDRVAAATRTRTRRSASSWGKIELWRVARVAGRSVAPGSQREIRILAVPWVVSWIASAECRMLGLFLSLPDRRGAAGGHQLVSCRGPLDAAPGGAVEPQLRRFGRVRVLTSWQTGRGGLGTLRL